MSQHHVIVRRLFGDHEIVIFGGAATKFDTARCTVMVRATDGSDTWRVGCVSEAQARTVANYIWGQLRSGRRQLRAICREASSSSVSLPHTNGVA